MIEVVNMLFLCYAVYENGLDCRKPSYYCIMGDGELYEGATIEHAKQKALEVYPLASFVDNCGWIFVGEEEKLLDKQYNDILVYAMNIAQNKNAKGGK